MMTTIDRLSDFDKWLRKIGNIHYSNNNKMMDAYDRIINNEKSD